MKRRSCPIVSQSSVIFEVDTRRNEPRVTEANNSPIKYLVNATLPMGYIISFARRLVRSNNMSTISSQQYTMVDVYFVPSTRAEEHLTRVRLRVSPQLLLQSASSHIYHPVLRQPQLLHQGNSGASSNSLANANQPSHPYDSFDRCKTPD